MWHLMEASTPPWMCHMTRWGESVCFFFNFFIIKSNNKINWNPIQDMHILEELITRMLPVVFKNNTDAPE